MGKGKTYTEASNGSGAEARRETARNSMRGNDARGGLLGRMAGAAKGGAVCAEGTEGGNAGSNAFAAMQLEAMGSDYQIDWSRVK